MVKVQKSSGRKSSYCHRRQMTRHPAVTPRMSSPLLQGRRRSKTGGVNEVGEEVWESTDRVEMEEDQPREDTQHSPEAQTLPEVERPSDRTPHQASGSAKAPSQSAEQEEPQTNVSLATRPQIKPLWKPIPPLLPETHPETKDQSCQTEAWLQEDAGSQGHGAGVCVEPGDPPLLQQPLQTSKSGIQQIIECFRSGTAQLKHMLLREVDTIFECKMCRSLFRGLPNLITHKEYYCLSRLADPDGSSGDDRQSVAIKDLLDSIYPKADRPDFVVRLEPIQTTTKAVFQYLTTEEELARFPLHTASARESPVAWEGEPEEGGDGGQPSQPDNHGSSPAPNQTQKRWEAEETSKDEQTPHEDEGSTSGVEDVTISCCLCGQDFKSRRSIRRHCRKMHQTKLEELRKFTETRTVPTSLLSMVKGRPRALSTLTGKSCPVCLKTFATKANLRRHFDEVHQGLRRDNSAPGGGGGGGGASRPGQPFSLEATPPRKSNNSSPTRSQNSKSTPASSKTTPSNQNQPKTQLPSSPQASSASCRCTICKRNYISQLMLKRHMRIVHKIYSIKGNNRPGATPAPAPAAVIPNSSNTNSGPSNNARGKEEAAETSEEDVDTDSSPAPSPSDSTGTAKSVPAAHNAVKVKEEEAPSSPKTTPSPSLSSSRGANACSAGVSVKMTKLSVGFDFKQLFCKLCKRQFSSRQNLTKHIELHTDGNDIFIKFYRCPLCRYESRRKRDVLRHVTVVHKKSSAYLAKIMPKLESRAVKRLAEAVLNSTHPNKRTSSGAKEEVNGRQASSSAASGFSSTPPVTRKQQDLSSPAFTPSPPFTRKQERQQTHQHRPISPPLTRRSEKHALQRNSAAATVSSMNQTPHTRRHDAQSDGGGAGSSTEVRVTKNFSLHACDQCGRAFAKKLYLESHKRSHRNAATTAANRRKGVSTRSKSLAW